MTEVEVEFMYDGTVIVIQCGDSSLMKDVCQLFAKKADIDIKSVFFIYGGNQLDQEKSFITQANSSDKERKRMTIIVTPSLPEEEDTSKIKAKQVICPTCGENARITINNFKVNLFACKNGHEINNLFLNEYVLTPEIDQSKIKCGDCKECDKGKAFNNQFFSCLSCKKNLCPLCNSKHDKSHKIINYDDKNFICDIHNELFNSFCETCQKDICLLCETDHNGHDIIYYSKIIVNKDKKLNQLKYLRKGIDILQKDVNDIINHLNKFVEYMNILYNINLNIVNNFDIKKRNYILLKNVDDLNIETYCSYINPIINNESINYKFEKMMNIYNDMINKNYYDKYDENSLIDTILEKINKKRNIEKII